MFSIVIPVFNAADVISQTIDSVLNQSFTNFELIVINDGSTDSTLSVLHGICDERLCIIDQPNGGVSSARNKGIKFSNNPWVCFLDADDWWHPKYLEVVSQCIEANSEAQFVATSFYAKPHRADWTPKPWFVDTQSVIVEKIVDLPSRWMKNCPFFTSGVCITKQLLAPIDECFKEGESHGEDLDLWFRLAERVSVFLIKEKLVIYRTEQCGSLNQSCGFIKPLHISRLSKRLLNQTVPKHLVRSSKVFITHYKITRTRKLLKSGERKKALEEFREINYGYWLKRYWFTILLLLMPLFIIKRYEQKNGQTLFNNGNSDVG